MYLVSMVLFDNSFESANRNRISMHVECTYKARASVVKTRRKCYIRPGPISKRLVDIGDQESTWLLLFLGIGAMPSLWTTFLLGFLISTQLNLFSSLLQLRVSDPYVRRHHISRLMLARQITTAEKPLRVVANRHSSTTFTFFRPCSNNLLSDYAKGPSK